MNSEVQKIQKIYDKDFHYCVQTMKELSKDDHDKANVQYLVNDTTEAFNFDTIKTYLYPNPPFPTSADALYFCDSILFIEFKSGYKPQGNNNIKYRKNCEDSARDSIMIHRFYLSTLSISNINNVKTKFIAVINSGAFGNPSMALGNAYAGNAGITYSLKTKLQNLFTGKDLLNQATFYTEVDVWNDQNFSSMLSSQ